jgi:hypothetical protein
MFPWQGFSLLPVIILPRCPKGKISPGYPFSLTRDTSPVLFSIYVSNFGIRVTTYKLPLHMLYW